MTEETSKPRIALACTSFSGGGAERVMVTLANKFIEWGYPVDFIVGVDKGPYKNMLSQQANKIPLADEAAGRIKKRLQASKRLYQYLRKNESVHVLSTLREFNVFLSAAIYFSRLSVELYVREADTLDRLFVVGGFRNRVLLKLMRFFYPKSKGVIANCNITKNDLVEYVDLACSSVKVIYNPLDIGFINTSEKKLKTDCVKIVACGRLVEKKNFPDLIRSINLVKERYPEVSLNILGQGPEEENLQQLIDELGLTNSVNLVGFVDNPYEYYAAASVFVQTSLWEGFGYVLAEAMACGTPVVAYDSKGAMREILDNGKYGLLTPVGDLQALANAIIQQIEQPTPQYLLEEAVQRFDVDLIAKQYLEALGVTHE